MYAFSAWIDERGSNMDRRHHECTAPERCLGLLPYRCKHLRLWDLNRRHTGYNVIRIVRRKRPLYLGVFVGSKYRTMLRLGRRT